MLETEQKYPGGLSKRVKILAQKEEEKRENETHLTESAVTGQSSDSPSNLSSISPVALHEFEIVAPQFATPARKRRA